MPRSIKSHLRPGVGDRLRKARLKARLSQRELAFPGCTAAYISRLEAEERNPSLQMVAELARRLGVDAYWLATGKRRSDAVSAALVAGQEFLGRFNRAVTPDGAVTLSRLEEVVVAAARFERALAQMPAALAERRR
jgi:transcriptional regulator with XRE-family HTH domain